MDAWLTPEPATMGLQSDPFCYGIRYAIAA